MTNRGAPRARQPTKKGMRPLYHEGLVITLGIDENLRQVSDVSRLIASGRSSLADGPAVELGAEGSGLSVGPPAGRLERLALDYFPNLLSAVRPTTLQATASIVPPTNPPATGTILVRLTTPLSPVFVKSRKPTFLLISVSVFPESF